MNARERVRQALLCRKPEKIPKVLRFFVLLCGAETAIGLALGFSGRSVSNYGSFFRSYTRRYGLWKNGFVRPLRNRISIFFE